jgi:outer membrane PBP1 activator LpoA protein
MAAISRRPRPALCAALVIAALMAACSLLKPEQVPADKQERALRLSHDGKHAEAAQVYAELALELPADHDNYELLSAEQWLAAGNVAAAKQSFAAVSEDARTRLATPRALVAAEIAYAENDGARAIRELDQISVPTSADQAQNYWWIRGRSAFLTGHPVEGTRALVERERGLSDRRTAQNSTVGFAPPLNTVNR